MHIKRLLSGSLAVMMVATSFNVPINAKAAEIPDVEPEAGLEENQELPSSDAEISLDDETNVVVEEAAEEPEVVAPKAEETPSEEPTEELVVEEETATQDVVGDDDPIVQYDVTFDSNGAKADTREDSEKTFKSSASDEVTLVTDLSKITPPDNKYFAGWGDAADSTTPVEDAGGKVTVSANKTFYAIWKDVTITPVLTGENDSHEVTYSAAAQKATFAVKKGDDNITGTAIAYQKKGSSGEYASDESVIDAGEYKAVLSKAADTSTGVGAISSEFEYKIVPKAVEQVDGAVTFTFAEGTAKDDDDYILTYEWSDGDNPTKSAKKIEPSAVVVKDGETPLTADVVGENGEVTAAKDYSIAHTGSFDAVGTVTYTATLHGNYTGTLTGSYKIVECNHKGQTWTVKTRASIEKNTQGKYEAKAGVKEIAECSVCHDKAITDADQVIPAVDLAKIKVRGDRSDKVHVSDLKINGLYDTTGKLLKPSETATKYTVTAVACKADGSVSETADENTYYKVTVAFANDATEYTGSYEIIEKFATPVDNDAFTRQIDKATFDHPGRIYWANSTGKEAKVGDKITVDGQDVTLTEENKNTYIKDIPQLNKEFTIKEYNQSDGFEFKGTPVEPKVELKDSTAATIPESVTTGEGASAVTTTYYELKYEGNTKPNVAAKVTVVMKNELYEGTASKTFKIVEAKEELVVPTLRKLDGTIVYSENNNNLYYGDKLQLVSPTKDAKIYYLLSTTADYDTYEGINASNYEEKGTLYRDTIELKEANAKINTSGSYPNYDAIKISAIIVKDGCTPKVMSPQTLSVYNKWGDVQKDTDIADYDDIPQNGLWISEYSLGAIQNKDGSSASGDELVYSGKAKEIPLDDLRVFFGTRKLVYNTDFTIKYTNNIHAAEYYAAKAPTITVVGKGRYAGGFTQTFTIDQKPVTPLTTPETADNLTLAENGKIQTPKITAYQKVWNASKFVNKNYVANKDYTVTYYDWKDTDGNNALDIDAPEITAVAGTKAAVVEMQGDYAGDTTVKYEIAATDKYLNKATVSIDSSAVVFDGNNQAAKVVTTVKVNDVELVRGTDYDVEFKELAYTDYFVHENLLTAGKYTVRIVPSATSLYKGYKDITYTFKGGIDITKAANVEIRGTEKKVVWSAAGAVFTKLQLVDKTDGTEKIMNVDSDYEANYSSNYAVGKATLTLIGRGKYTGTKKITFEVTPKYTLNKNDVAVDSLVYDYAGHDDIDDLNNKVHIKDGTGLDGDGQIANSDITFADTAKSGYDDPTDKVRVYYATKDMTNAGTKKLTIEGNPVQGYKGKVTVNFTIEPFDLDADQKKVDKDTPANSTNVVDFGASGYAGKIYPEVKWYYNPDRTYGAYTRLSTKEINNNFTIKYSTKKFNAGTKGTATFTPKAKKNFKGSPVQVEYTINTVPISRNMIVINDQGTNDKTTKFGKGVAPVVTFGGTKLKANTDYTVEYFYNVDAAGTHARFEKPAPTDIMKAGTIITCRVTGKGNYDGSVDVDYKYVLSANLATNAKFVQKTKKIYEGSPVTLEAGTDFDITLGTDTSKDAKGKVVKTPHVLTTDQYKVVSVTNNEKPGTAKVTIALSGEYGGTKTFNFKIDKKSMDYRVEFAVGVVPTGATVTGKTAAMTSKTSTFKSLPTSGFTVSKKEGKTTTKYAFAGWFTDEACTQAVVTPIGKAYEPDIAPGETKTLYAKYVAPSEYTITFDANGGTKAKESAVVTQKIAIGAKKALQANPFVRAGYKFEGWDTNAAGTTPVFKDKAQVVNVTTGTAVTLKAVWTPITYKITYKNVDTKSDTYDGPLSAAKVIEDPTKAGYTFEGWKVEIKGQKAETGKKAYSIPKDTAADVTLTATWKANEVTIKFTNTVELKDPTKYVAETKVNADKKVTLPKLVAADSEKVFVGWQADTTVYKGGTQQAFTSGTTLTAVWADKKYTITYVLDGGKIVSSEYPTAFTKVKAATTTLPTVTKFGYSFAKWELVEGSKATELAGGKLPADTAKNVKVRPVWEENKSKLVITLKPGTGADADQSDQPVTIYPGGAANINNSFTRKNYDFAGWQATGLPETTYDDKAVISNNGDGTADKTATLTATWTKHNYIVNYDLNGATNTENASWLYDEGSRKTFVYKVGEPLTLETAPVRKGYTFVGWYNGTYDEKNPDTNKVTEIAVNTAEGAAAPTDVTVKAQWKAIDYTATLTLNGGKLADSIVATEAAAGKWVYDSAESPTKATQKYTINGSVTLPTPVKENYTFDGWFTDSAFTEGNEITSIPVGTAENTTVYAKFTENKKVTITFDEAGGTGTMANQVIYSGKSANLSENKYTKDGFTFAGWKVTSVDGKAVTGNAETYADKGSFSAGTLTADKAVTLTAQWTANQ